MASLPPQWLSGTGTLGTGQAYIAAASSVAQCGHTGPDSSVCTMQSTLVLYSVQHVQLYRCFLVLNVTSAVTWLLRQKRTLLLCSVHPALYTCIVPYAVHFSVYYVLHSVYSAVQCMSGSNGTGVPVALIPAFNAWEYTVDFL